MIGIYLVYQYPAPKQKSLIVLKVALHCDAILIIRGEDEVERAYLF